ncbi:Uncharacterised protein [Pseudomonas aeruginosa]|nr:Uncharacterised protein [Pseudomonas aeruginosa]
MACSSWARWYFRSMAWAWVLFSWGAGLGHVGPGDDAGAVFVLGHLQRTLVGRHRVVEQADLFVHHPQLQVVLRQLRLLAEAHRGEVGGAGMQARLVGLQLPAQLAPEVDLPADTEVGRVAGADRARAAAAHRRASRQQHGAVAAALAAAGLAHVAGDRREERRPRAAHQRLGLAELRHRLGQGLVGTFQVHLQVVQGLVAVQLPPGAALEHVARLGAAPAFGFLEFGGHRQVRSLVVGADGAAAEGGDQGQGKQRGGVFHRGVSSAPSVRTPRFWLTQWRRRSR